MLSNTPNGATLVAVDDELPITLEEFYHLNADGIGPDQRGEIEAGLWLDGYHVLPGAAEFGAILRLVG